jgi:hypothetical protein
MNRNMLAAKAKQNLLVTSNRGIRIDQRKTLVFGSSEGEQSHAARALDGGRQQALMAGAVSGDPARRHLASFGNKLRDHSEILVVM